MAKAFIASVPLALVLVAAVIVPVAVTPGSFGFNQWPEPEQHLAGEAPVVIQVAEEPVAARNTSRPAPAEVADRGTAVASADTPVPARARRPAAPPAPRPQAPAVTPAEPDELAQAPAPAEPPPVAPEEPQAHEASPEPHPVARVAKHPRERRNERRAKDR